jgi:hypothetical protein
MSKHSNKTFRHAKSRNDNGVRPGEFPRWSNGVLLNPASGRSSARPEHARGTNRTHHHSAPRAAAIATPEVGKFISQQLSHGRHHRVLVMTKRESTKGWNIPYSSRFEPTKQRNDSRKGSEFVATTKLHGRPVFLDRASPKPTDRNRVYGFELVGENPGATVYFAKIIRPEDFVKPSSISIDVRTGKIVANNARLPKLCTFKSKKPLLRPDVAINDEPNFDDLFGDSRWDFDYAHDDGVRGFVCTSDCDEDDCTCDREPESFFEVELAEKNALRPMNATWCHNCGCRICECDGTPQVDGQPYLMPAHLTQVRFPSRERSLARTQRRQHGWR